MIYAVIIAVGLVAGAAEFILLKRFTGALLSGNVLKAAAVFPLKLLLLAVGLLPSIIWRSDLLWLSGCCIVVPLITCAIVNGIRGSRNGGETNE